MTIKDKLHIVSKEFFQAGLITYAALLANDLVYVGTVSNFFDLNHLLLLVLIAGIFMAMTDGGAPLPGANDVENGQKQN